MHRLFKLTALLWLATLMILPPLFAAGEIGGKKSGPTPKPKAVKIEKKTPRITDNLKDSIRNSAPLKKTIKPYQLYLNGLVSSDLPTQFPMQGVRDVMRETIVSPGAKGGRRYGRDECTERPSNIRTVGTSKVIAILAKRAGDTAPMSRDAACSKLRDFGDEIADMSYGRLHLDIECTDWISVELPENLYFDGLSHFNADYVIPAADGIVDYSEYDQIIIVVPPRDNYFRPIDGSCPAGSSVLHLLGDLTTEQPNFVGITEYTSSVLDPPPGLVCHDYNREWVLRWARYVLRQEFLHSLGLVSHANLLDECPDLSGWNCTEYGDWYDPMGAGILFSDTNGYFKQALGWSHCCEVDPNASGDHLYSFHTLDNDNPSPCNCLQFEASGHTYVVDANSEILPTINPDIDREESDHFNRYPGAVTIRRVSTVNELIYPRHSGIHPDCTPFSYPVAALIDSRPESRDTQESLDAIFTVGSAYVNPSDGFMVAPRGFPYPESANERNNLIWAYVGPVDTEPPVVYLDPRQPGDGAVFSDWRAIGLHIVARATDNVGISRVEFKARRPSKRGDKSSEWIELGSDTSGAIQDQANGYLYEWSGIATPGSPIPGNPGGGMTIGGAPRLDFGHWIIRAVAFDVAGNRANGYQDFDVEFRSERYPIEEMINTEGLQKKSDKKSGK